MSTADMPLPSAAILTEPARVLIVRAPYYRDVVDGMTEGARRMLEAAGAVAETEDVAGAFELPQAIRLIARAAANGVRYDGFVALGCVVKGDTDHYDHICRETHTGLMNVALQFGLCLGTGVLTVHTEEQAIMRSRLDRFNKGAEAAAACLMQIVLARKVGA